MHKSRKQNPAMAVQTQQKLQELERVFLKACDDAIDEMNTFIQYVQRTAPFA